MPASETARGISSMFTGQYVGAAIAPLIVIPVAVAVGWRATFFVNGFIGIIWVLVCYWWFRNEPSGMKHISIAELNKIQSERKYIPLQQRFSWNDVVANSNIRRMVVPFFCSQWALYFFVAWMPVYLQQGRHFSESTMKFIVSLIFIVGIIGALGSGMLGDWLTRTRNLAFSRRIIGMLALCMTGFSFLAAAIISSDTVAAACLVTGNLFFAFFGNVAFSTCVDVGGNQAGTIAGVMNFFGQMGSFLLSVFFGKMVDATHNFNFPLYIIAAFLVTGGLVWLSVDPRKKVAPQTIKQVLATGG